MEETQDKISEFLNLDQFSVVSWKKGVPAVLIDFLIQITGDSQRINDMFARKMDLLYKASKENLAKFSKDQTDPRAKRLGVYASKELSARVYKEDLHENAHESRRSSIEPDDYTTEEQQKLNEAFVKNCRFRLGEKKFGHVFRVFKVLCANPDKAYQNK